MKAKRQTATIRLSEDANGDVDVKCTFAPKVDLVKLENDELDNAVAAMAKSIMEALYELQQVAAKPQKRGR